MDDELMTGAEVARLANVGRAAVSNWKKRFADFPQDCGEPGMPPLYRRSDVESWLEKHRKGLAVPAKSPGRPKVTDRKLNTAVREIQQLSSAFTEPAEIARLVAVLRRMGAPEAEDDGFITDTAKG